MNRILQAIKYGAARMEGLWHNNGIGCGWVWGTPSNTRRILETLVKRGLVQKDSNGV